MPKNKSNQEQVLVELSSDVKLWTARRHIPQVCFRIYSGEDVRVIILPVCMGVTSEKTLFFWTRCNTVKVTQYI